MRKNTIVVVSGYFNPLHVGHIKLLKHAKKLGDMLIVILNNRHQIKIKKSIPFQGDNERMSILKAIKYVDTVFLSIDGDRTVCKTLESIVKIYGSGENYIFANGGDRKMKGDIPERFVCYSNNIRMVFGVGGGKIQSSSKLIKKANAKI